jgi:glutamate-1-semialdehyde 2,1-aminomutase
MAENSGVALYRHAKTLIPGGTQLLSKRPEMFLPEKWPAYYSRAKGVEVWDLDGKHYFDFATVGVGACALGYADDDVDAAVIAAIRAGSMCTLNAPEEVELAERLVALHPWADMARFQRCGGEACAVAIRIARAATARGKVAICGYHGWTDWYLAANLGDATALDGQLLPGLDPSGVPRELAGTARTFNYNRLEELEAIAARHGGELAAIIMEPVRATAPEPGFLEGVRAIADRTGAVLIFDEVTSGFRINLGGIHMTMGVEPDMAVFGKALGNGFPISAVIGRRAVMDSAEGSFISSTMWTDRIGPTSAVATLEKMERDSVQSALVRFGEALNAGWTDLAARHGLAVYVSGIPPLTHLSFDFDQAAEAQTLYTQEMLKRGYLLGASVYTAFAYTDEIIQEFLSDSDEVFGTIREAFDSGDISSYLEGPVKHSGFRRLA